MTPYDPGIRLFVSVPLSEGATVDLAPAQAHYLRNVMRCKPGDAVRLFNGRDGEWRARLERLAKAGAAALVEAQAMPQRAEPDLWLVFAPVKRGPIDFIVQKATELGVGGLRPVFTRYTAVSRVNLDRMRANAIEAAEQCARLSVPDIVEPTTLATLLDRWPSGRRLLFCDERSIDVPVIETLAGERAAMPEPWAVLVGPEGGFAAEEAERLRNFPGAVPVGLGRRLLRADTAALAALACWQAVLGDWTGAGTHRR